MYKVFDGAKWIEFASREKLVNWLAAYNMPGMKRNTFLEHVGINDGDMRHNVYFYAGLVEHEWSERMYRIVDENGRSLYDKEFIREVLEHTPNKEIERQWREDNRAQQGKTQYYSGKYHRLPESAYPEFRRGPVPYIHGRYKFGGVYRHIKTTNERRATCNDESRPFNRARRAFNLPDLWYDEPLRDWRNSGWKKQGRNKRQWELGVKNKTKHTIGKNTYVVKVHNIEVIDTNDEDCTLDIGA